MMSQATTYVVDANEADFEQVVIANSKQIPIVVDFWAPWCGPCRTLGPTLERLANEGNGSWLLVKVNVDNNQRLSQSFGVQGIPAVKAFKDGKIIDQFTGALPESQIKAWLKKFVADPSANIVNQLNELATQNPQAGRQAYAAYLSEQPHNHAARLAYGLLLMRLNDSESTTEFAKISAGSEQYESAQAWLTLARAVQEAMIVGTGIEEQYNATVRAFAQADYATAIEGLLDIIRINRSWRDDAARKTLLALLTALGNTHPLVPQARRDLAAALF
jgi:putative thioredoxin